MAVEYHTVISGTRLEPAPSRGADVVPVFHVVISDIHGHNIGVIGQIAGNSTGWCASTKLGDGWPMGPYKTDVQAMFSLRAAFANSQFFELLGKVQDDYRRGLLTRQERDYQESRICLEYSNG